jgi:hypothetical protein
MTAQERLDKAREALIAFDKRWGQHIPDAAGRAEFQNLKAEYLAADDAVRDDTRLRARILEIATGPHGVRANPPEPTIRQPHDLHDRQRDALRAVDRMHRKGDLTERATVNLDAVIRRDELGTDARYLAATFDPAYMSAYLTLYSAAARGQGGWEMAGAALRSVVVRVTDTSSNIQQYGWI